MVLILIGHKSPIFVNRVQKENLTGSHKGYHLYDPNRKKVIHSRDVVFNETSVPGVQKEHKEHIKNLLNSTLKKSQFLHLTFYQNR